MGKKTYIVNSSFFSVFLILFLFSLLTFPGYAGEGASKIDRIKKAGVLIVGTSADYPPYEFHLMNDKDGDLVGIDIDIAKVIAEELGVRLEVRDIIFSRIFDSLEAGQIDLGIAGLHPTEERRKRVDFSDIYYQAIQTIVIRVENAERITTVEDLRGKIIGIQKDSIQEDMARSHIEGASFVVRETIEELIINLKKGLVDALIMEKPVAESYVRRDKDFRLVECKKFIDKLGSAIAVRKIDVELLAEINRILKKLKEEKKIDEFVENAKMLTDKK